MTSVLTLDVETTGVWEGTDRVITLCMSLDSGDGGNPMVMTWGFDPEMRIPCEATAVHGLSQETIDDNAWQPMTEEQAQYIKKVIDDADYVCGHNVGFDIKFIAMELGRFFLKLEVPEAKRIDTMALWRRLYPSSLEGVFVQLFGYEPEVTHNAEADVKATVEILENLLETGDGVAREPFSDIHELAKMARPEKREDYVDKAGFFRWRDGEVYFGVGKPQGEKLSEARKGLLEWVLKQDFAKDTKSLAEGALNGVFPTKKDGVVTT